MIEEYARIVKIDTEDSAYAWVEPQQKTSCGSCVGKSSCGTSLLAKILGRRNNPIKVLNNVKAKKGDSVIIAIDDSILIVNSILVYFMPLVLMLVGSFFAILIAQYFSLPTFQTDLSALIFAIAGFMFGMILLKHYTARKQMKSYNQVKIIKISTPHMQDRFKLEKLSDKLHE